MEKMENGHLDKQSIENGKILDIQEKFHKTKYIQNI